MKPISIAPVDSKVTLIGFAGRSGSGKSTIAKALRDYFMDSDDITPLIIPFAKQVRDEIYDTLATPKPPNLTFRAEFYAWAVFVLTRLLGQRKGSDFRKALYAKPTPPLIRKLLQWWGTDFRRRQDSDYWLKAHAQEMYDTFTFYPIHNHKLIIIDDVRFPNEVDYILNNTRWQVYHVPHKHSVNYKFTPGLVFWVNNPTYPPPPHYRHPSETSLSAKDVHFTITNDPHTTSPSDIAKQIVNEYLPFLKRPYQLSLPFVEHKQ